MGQKVNPIGLRVGVNRTWDSRWYADGAEYVKLLHEDFALREFLEKRLSQAGISKIVIERGSMASSISCGKKASVTLKFQVEEKNSPVLTTYVELNRALRS